MLTMSDRTVTHRLWGYAEWEEAQIPVRALLFGHLAKRAAPVVEMFLSDLSHDAEWLRVNVEGATSFYFGVRAYGGTDIGFDGDLIAKHNEATWKVDLYSDAGREWFADFTRIGVK